MYDGLMDYVFISSCVPTIDVQDVLISISFFPPNSFFLKKETDYIFFVTFACQNRQYAFFLCQATKSIDNFINN